ncbi:hypothetical protein A3J61_00020 [Candidatus Nomurabacteria bacterium RIFCSPHIGHO2_02_FULL_38_15]|uniref:Uncharacterized protein n=1 Tax=Candidatus Nomurabacteria bacterium RIFCSPHIGHO2_02_FULL_38_15 TaxID=1801752 RepID=A0A1F6VQ76_9BACT|nr:MAG: hypothetical protein A3J61_00020 [Candidatus Nomurabacteria bacterium RIFCSPHIGHO2_02_FULL_38_15]
MVFNLHFLFKHSRIKKADLTPYVMEVYIENLEDTKTFQLIGPSKVIEGLAKKLDETSDFVDLGILNFSNLKMLESIDSGVGQKSDLWITCNSEVFDNVKTYLTNFLDDHDCILV